MNVFSKLAEKWPSAFVAREKVEEFSGGILHSRTMANIDSQGIGPEKVRFGRKIAYPVDSLIMWMENKLEMGVQNETNKSTNRERSEVREVVNDRRS